MLRLQLHDVSVTQPHRLQAAWCRNLAFGQRFDASQNGARAQHGSQRELESVTGRHRKILFLESY